MRSRKALVVFRMSRKALVAFRMSRKALVVVRRSRKALVAFRRSRKAFISFRKAVVSFRKAFVVLTGCCHSVREGCVEGYVGISTFCKGRKILGVTMVLSQCISLSSR